MIIVGAKGLAKEVLEIVLQNNQLDGLAFFDDVSNDLDDYLYDKFPVLKNEAQVQNHLMQVDPKFIIGIGKPKLRHKLFVKFRDLGGRLTSAISPLAQLGSYKVSIGEGTIVFPYAVLSNSASIGKAGLAYYNVVVTHDCVLGDFVELSPGATILGRCRVGDYTQIGSNATVLPDLRIGRNVLIGAGSVVTKNVPDNVVIAGVPARIIGEQEPLSL